MPLQRYVNRVGMVSGKPQPLSAFKMILTSNNGLAIDGVPFVLDATRTVPFSFVSHAHADHCGRHRKILCTAPTAALAEARYGKRRFLTLPIRQPEDIEGITVELFEAGHVLGSAQIMLTVDGNRILYSGDLKPIGGRTTAPAGTPGCDVLILEATFGRPEYVFPSAAETAEQLELLIKRVFVRGLTPVIMAYALGKAQEAMALLSDRGFTFACHRMVYNMVEIYRKFGVELPGAELFDGDRLRDQVVVMPPGHQRRSEWQFIRNPYTIFLSGWALDDARKRKSCDITLPLSDHADYPQLIEFVERVNPRFVLTHHGFPELAADLRRRGVKAMHLDKEDCVDLLAMHKVQRPISYNLFDRSL